MLPPFTCIYQAFGQDLGKIWARFKPSLKHQEGTISAVHCYQDSHPIFAVHARFVPIRATFQDRADRRTDNRKTLWPLAAFKALAFKSRTTQALPSDRKIGQIAQRQTGHCELAGNLDALRESMNGLIEVLEQQIDHFHGGTKMVQDQFPASGKSIGGLRAEKGHDHERGESNERTERNNPGPDFAHRLAVKERVRSAQYAALKAVNTELVGLYRDTGQMIAEKVRKSPDGAGRSWKTCLRTCGGSLPESPVFRCRPLVHAQVLSGIQWP
jgi:hypothetical protein